MERTEVEKRLDELMAQYPNTEVTRFFTFKIKALCEAMADSVPLEHAAFIVVQHATGFVAALKMTGQLRPELAATLVEDFSETINKRAFPGVPMLVNPK